MAGIEMVPGGIYSLRVTKREANKKQFMKGVDPAFRHDIWLQDPKKPEILPMRAEYVTSTPDLPLTVMIEGAVQYIRCKTVDPRGNEIEPCDPEADTRRQIPIVHNVRSTALPRPASDNMPLPSQVNCNDKNISGKSIAFGIAYAKDIKVAEIANREKGAKVTEEDIQDVVKWGIHINNGICDFLNF